MIEGSKHLLCSHQTSLWAINAPHAVCCRSLIGKPSSWQAVSGKVLAHVGCKSHPVTKQHGRLADCKQARIHSWTGWWRQAGPLPMP